MGPSGSGKTTLLNSLAGQLVMTFSIRPNLGWRLPHLQTVLSPSSKMLDDVFPASVRRAQVSSKGLRLEGNMAVNGVEVSDGAAGIRKAYVRQVDGPPTPVAPSAITSAAAAATRTPPRERRQRAAARRARACACRSAGGGVGAFAAC